MLDYINCNILKNHNYVTVDRWTDIISTTYKNTGKKKFWIVSFNRCIRCGHKKLETDYDYEILMPHTGLEKLRLCWEDKGFIPAKPGDKKSQNNKKSSSVTNNEFSDKVTKILLHALSTEHEQESINFFLKAKRFHMNDKNFN